MVNAAHSSLNENGLHGVIRSRRPPAKPFLMIARRWMDLAQENAGTAEPQA